MSTNNDYIAGLGRFCTTARQEEILSVYIAQGNSAKHTGIRLGVDERYVRKVLHILKTRAAEEGSTQYFD